MERPHRAIRTRTASFLVLILVLGLALVTACGDDEPTRPKVATTIADSLVFMRADSLALDMGDTPLVCCGLFDPSFANEEAIRLVMWDPSYQKPGWQIIILIDHVAAGQTFTLPAQTVPPSKIPPVELFVADDPNELSSEEEDSSGSITVHSLQCSATTIQIDFSVDGILGSEFGDGPTMRVRGRFQGTFPKTSCPS